MKKFTEEERKKYVSESLIEFKAEVEKRLKAQMKYRGISSDGELYKSLLSELTDENTLSTAFSDYGRFVDMKNINTNTSMMPVAFTSKNSKYGFKSWVKENLNKFKYVPGYKNKSISEVPKNIAIDRIAWGVAISRSDNSKSAQKRKAKRWYAKTFWGTLDFLIQTLIDKQSAIIRDAITGKL
jgi:hypothetical protein